MPGKALRQGLALAAIIATFGCSSKGDDYGTGGGGGGTRVFASGNLAGNGASFTQRLPRQEACRTSVGITVDAAAAACRE